MAFNNPDELNPCNIGLALNEECHTHSVFKCTLGLNDATTFSEKDRKLLEWRSGVLILDDSIVCNHHKKQYLYSYEHLQKQCCDPYKKHKKAVKKSLRVIDEDTAKILNVKPGQKLCPSCRKIKLPEANKSSTDDNYLDTDTEYDQLNVSASSIGVSPLKHDVRSKKRVGYAKRKMRDIKSATKVKVAKLLNVPQEELTSSDQENVCQNCKDLNTLVELLKEKCSKATTRKEKIQLLTIAPESWSINKIVNEFQVTHYMVKAARELKKSNGILAVPASKKGKVLPPEVIQRVTEFYESDEFSRMCPGQKEFVSVRIDGIKQQMQKRLILVNLKELYQSYKIKNPADKIGFSKFCELRPKWCLTVNSRGMHFVCVCQLHQNVKLLVAAVPGRLDYKDLLEKMVCDINNRDCMMLSCNRCPGKNALIEEISNIFTENEMDFDEMISYKQWVHTDRTTIASLQLPVNEFIEIIVNAFDGLRQHHFVTKSQAAYLKKLKEDLPNDSAIVLLDFAENYSFLIQDAIQGFYWDNSQATLHPSVVYYKANDELKCLSTCVISDCLKHDTSTVHAFNTRLISYIQDVLPHLKRLIYFSDGAASQYKNYKNITNICHHKLDHGLSAEWHFFATSHGKSPCDGIGGTTKRLVARASLQATNDHQILTANDMYKWVCKNIEGIKFFFVTDEQVQGNVVKFELDARYASSKTVSGTRSHHSFVPVSENKLEMRRLSADDIFSTVVIDHLKQTSLDSEQHHTFPTSFPDEYQPGKYIACIYDKEWYVGTIDERDDENNDVHVRFMNKSKRTGNLSWPLDNRNECYVPIQDIICIISAPVAQGHGGRQYKLSSTDTNRIMALLPNFN